MGAQNIWEVQQDGFWKVVSHKLLFFLNLACKSQVTIQESFCATDNIKFFSKLLLFSSSCAYSFAVGCCLSCGFVATMHQSPLGFSWRCICHLFLAFEVHTLDLIKAQTSRCFGSRAHWIGLGSSKTWIPLLSPDQGHSAAVDKFCLHIFGINFQTFFQLRSFIPMCCAEPAITWPRFHLSY